MPSKASRMTVFQRQSAHPALVSASLDQWDQKRRTGLIVTPDAMSSAAWVISSNA